MPSACASFWQNDRMTTFEPHREPSAWGTWEDAEALRRWSFARRTPEQRLAWLRAALELAYQSGALQPRRPDSTQRDPQAGGR
jgi:hypothetical protein